MTFVVAIDGPAAAGKGTIAKAVARQFGFLHLDSGLLYRAIGKATLNGQNAIAAAKSLVAAQLDDPTLRTADVEKSASVVAANPQVRAELIEFQRRFSQQDPGTVLDGRDIGTVICPDADVKLFVTASDGVRAQRRHAELAQKDATLTLEQVLQDVQSRDERDRERETAPLRPAKDAILLDTSELSIDAAIAAAIALVDARQ